MIVRFRDLSPLLKMSVIISLVSVSVRLVVLLIVFVYPS